MCSWTQFQCVHMYMCVCRFLTPTHTSQTPAGCGRIQLSSDIIYQDSTCKGLSPTRSPSTSDTSLKPSLLPGLLTDQLQLGGSNNPLQIRAPTESPGCYLYF